MTFDAQSRALDVIYYRRVQRRNGRVSALILSLDSDDVDHLVSDGWLAIII